MKNAKIIFTILTFAFFGFGFSMNGQVDDPKCYVSHVGTYSQVIVNGAVIYACSGLPANCIFMLEVDCDNQEQ